MDEFGAVVCVNALVSNKRSFSAQLNGSQYFPFAFRFLKFPAVLFKPFLEASPLVAKADFILNQQANAIGYELLGSTQLRRSPPQRAGEEFAEG